MSQHAIDLTRSGGPSNDNVPSVDRLRELFSYDANSGILTRKETVNPRALKGSEAGAINTLGYRIVSINRRSYLAHRIAWAMTYGEWPGGFIDHINANRCDNKIGNLRIASVSQNGANQRRSSVNTSGRKGVTWNKQKNKWMAQIKVNGRHKYLGLYGSLDEAHAAYCAAANENFGKFARAE